MLEFVNVGFGADPSHWHTLFVGQIDYVGQIQVNGGPPK